MELPGARLGEKNAERVVVMLDRLDIKRSYGIKIREFVEDGVVFEDGSKIESDLTMFIAATTGHRVFKDSDLPLNESGFIRTNEYCQVLSKNDDLPQYPKVFAIGDSAELQGPSWRAKQGHLAEVMARVAVKNFVEAERGKAASSSYVPHVSIMCLLDMGRSGFLVYRNAKRAIMIPLMILGHWMKRAWGWYYKNSKLKRFPRLPGL